MINRRAAILLSLGIGAALELGIQIATGRREAWDSGLFWTVGLPVALLASFAVGAFTRGRNWIWTVVIAPAQVFTMMVRSVELGGLWPLTLMLSAVLSAPFLFAAFVGTRFRGFVHSDARGTTTTRR